MLSTTADVITCALARGYRWVVVGAAPKPLLTNVPLDALHRQYGRVREVTPPQEDAPDAAA
jgi:hypothetical protein